MLVVWNTAVKCADKICAFFELDVRKEGGKKEGSMGERRGEEQEEKEKEIRK